MKKPRTSLLGRILGTTGGDPSSTEDQRQYARHRGGKQLILRIGKTDYPTLDWSVGGARFAAPDAEFTRGEEISGSFHRGLRRVKDRQFNARVARVAENGEVGLMFTELSHEAFAALGELQNEID